MKGLLAGIDVGSTSTRCVLYDLDGRAVSQDAFSTRSTHAERDGRRVWDFELLYRFVAKSCRAALGRVPEPCRLLGVAVAAVGCVPVFIGKDGAPVYTIFKDAARQENADEWMGKYDHRECFRITGYPKENNLAIRLLATGMEDPGAFEDLDCILTVSDYIAYRFSGTKAISHSAADSMSLWDWRTDDWWHELADVANLPLSALLKARPGGERIGGITPEAADLTGFPVGMPVSVGAHDYISAAFACVAEEKGTILNVTGTCDMLTTFPELPARTEFFRPGIRTLIDHSAMSDGASFTVECIGTGQLEWIRGNLFTVPGGGQPDWPVYFNGLEQAAPYGRELMLPHLFGRLVPDFNPPGLSGAFLGVTHQTDAVGFFRGAVTGLTFQTKMMFEVLLPACKDFRKFIQTGGAALSPAWCRLKASVLGVPVTVPEIVEATALGAALLAGIGSGVYGSRSEAAGVSKSLGERVYEPDPAAVRHYGEVYDRIYLPALADHERYDREYEKILKDNAKGCKAYG